MLVFGSCHENRDGKIGTREKERKKILPTKSKRPKAHNFHLFLTTFLLFSIFLSLICKCKASFSLSPTFVPPMPFFHGSHTHIYHAVSGALFLIFPILVLSWVKIPCTFPMHKVVACRRCALSSLPWTALKYISPMHRQDSCADVDINIKLINRNHHSVDTKKALKVQRWAETDT